MRLGRQSLPLVLPAATAEHWRAWLDKPLTAGVRPEHLTLAGGDEGLRATVGDAEYLGHETLLHLRLEELETASPVLTARLPGLQMFHRGETVQLALDGGHLHLFDPAGLALARGAEKKL